MCRNCQVPVIKPRMCKLILTSTPLVIQNRAWTLTKLGVPGPIPLHQRWRLWDRRARLRGRFRRLGAHSRPPRSSHAAGLGCRHRPPGSSSSLGPARDVQAASLELEFRAPHLGAWAPRAPLPSEGESSGAAAAVIAVVVGGAGGADWLGAAAAAVESGSVSGSGSASRPGVLLRGPGGDNCRIGLRPGTARDFFPIASPSVSRRRRAAERGGHSARRCVINIHTPRDCLPGRSSFNGGARARASALRHLRSSGSCAREERRALVTKLGDWLL